MRRPYAATSMIIRGVGAEIMLAELLGGTCHLHMDTKQIKKIYAGLLEKRRLSCFCNM